MPSRRPECGLGFCVTGPDGLCARQSEPAQTWYGTIVMRLYRARPKPWWFESEHFGAPEWTRTTTDREVHKALNLNQAV
jgi:hypothetical protein